MFMIDPGKHSSQGIYLWVSILYSYGSILSHRDVIIHYKWICKLTDVSYFYDEFQVGYELLGRIQFLLESVIVNKVTMWLNLNYLWALGRFSWGNLIFLYWSIFLENRAIIVWLRLVWIFNIEYFGRYFKTFFIYNWDISLDHTGRHFL